MIVDMLCPAIMPAILRSPINCGSVAMLAGLVIVPVVSLISPAPDAKKVEDVFACYEKPTQVPQKTALGK